MRIGDIYMEKTEKSRTFILKSVKDDMCEFVPFMQTGIDPKDRVLCHKNTVPYWLTCVASDRDAQLLRMNGCVTRSGGVSL